MVLEHLPDDYAADVAAIQHIDVVPLILDVVCHTTGLGFAAVARVTEERWVACAVNDRMGFGLMPGGELEIRTTICDEIRRTGRFVVIDDVRSDAVFRDHHTPKQYGFRSYISVPIVLPDGHMFGTLCAIDPRPALLSDVHVVRLFQLCADLIALHLDAEPRMAASHAAVTTASEHASLQRQIVAILGHDLRNPLAAVQTAARLLTAADSNPTIRNLAVLIERSADRMSSLIDNVLDFTRMRLTGGLPVTRREVEDLQLVLEQVVNELCTANPDRRVTSDVRIDDSLYCDPARIGQLVSNLLANALTHGDRAGAVHVAARSDDELVIAVSNEGPPIAVETLEHLFEPFVRGRERSGDPSGLGLGLHIASEIARAHDGTLYAISRNGETTFTFAMPKRRPSG